MVPKTTESTTNTISPTRRREKRTRPTNKIRTPGKITDNRRRLLRILRSNYNKKRQNGQFRTRNQQTKQKLHQKETTDAKFGRTTLPNLFRTIKKLTRPNLEISDRFRLRLRTDETGSRNKQTLCNYFAITGENLNGFYRFLKSCYGPADIPTIFQEKTDRILGH